MTNQCKPIVKPYYFLESVVKRPMYKLPINNSMPIPLMTENINVGYNCYKTINSIALMIKKL